MSYRRTRLVGSLIAVAVLSTALAIYLVISPDRTQGDVIQIEASLREPVVSTSTTSVSVAPVETTADKSNRQLISPNTQTLLSEIGAQESRVPIRLTIERIEVDAPITLAGVDSRSGQMAVPNNVQDVAWYKFGPTPGGDGSAVLAAHVDLAGPGRGVFWDLDELSPGDLVSVSFSDGTTERFVVGATTVYEKEELPLDVIFARSGSPVLTLITCGGGFNSDLRRYDSNVVVYATPVEPSAGSTQ